MADEIDAEAALDALLDAPNVAAAPEVAADTKVVETAPVETQVEETTETQTEETQTEGDETHEEETEAEAAPEITQERFRIKNDEDKAVVLLSKARGISIIEAAKLIQDQKTAEPAQVAEPAVDHVAAIDSEMSEIDKQIALLEENAEETLSPPDHKAIRALMEQKAELREARVYHITRQTLATEAKAQTAAEQAAAADQAQRELAYEKYPDLLKAGTPLFEAVTKRVSQVKTAATSEGIFDLVAGVAARLGILPVEASKPNGDKSGVTSPQRNGTTAKASTLIPVTAKNGTTPPRHTISHIEPDASTVFQEKMKNAKSDRDIDEALGLETAGASTGRLGKWS